MQLHHHGVMPQHMFVIMPTVVERWSIVHAALLAVSGVFWSGPGCSNYLNTCPLTWQAAPVVGGASWLQYANGVNLTS